jgi:hypothetical protein
MTRYTASIEVLQFDSIKVLETASDATTCVITAHGAEDGEFVVNITRSTSPPVYFGTADSCRRKVMSSTTSQFNVTASISGQTRGDVVALYKYKDVTQYLTDGSLDMNLSSRGNNEASFTMEVEYTTPKEFMHIGGWDDGFIYGRTYGFNMIRRTWETYSNCLINARHIGVDIKGKMYMMQGQTYSGGWIYRDDTTEYTLSTDTWATKADSSVGKTACMGAVCDDQAYVYGGANTTSGYNTGNEKYDPDTDAWTTLTDGGANAAGKGLNLSNTLFVAYGRTAAGFMDSDFFYIPYTDTWHTFFVNHSAPNRIFTALSRQTYGHKANLLGGCSSVDGDPANAIDYHTAVNFITKTYHENEAWWQNIQEPGAGSYEDYGAIVGGMNNTMFVAGSYLDNFDWWLKTTDEAFYMIADIPLAIASGQGVSI